MQRSETAGYAARPKHLVGADRVGKAFDCMPAKVTKIKQATEEVVGLLSNQDGVGLGQAL